MNDRSKHALRKPRVQLAVAGVIEHLEARAYLTGVVLGPATNLTTSSVGIAPVFANLADFTGSGDDSLVVANSTNSVSILPSNGDGSFGSPTTIPVQGAPLPLAFADLGNGHLDIIAGTTGTPGNISIILGNGNGTFGAANNIPALANNQAIAVGAFRDGGHPDVLTVSNSASNVNNAGILFGNGDGSFGSLDTFSLPHGNVASVAVGIFNGHLGFVVVNQNNNSVSVFNGNGNGTFQAPVDYPTGPAPTSIVVGDFNGDGNPDIVTADSAGGEVSFLAGNGDGTFKAPVNSAVAGTTAPGGPLKVRMSNFNNDSVPDLLVLDNAGAADDATVLLGNGNGTFHTGTTIALHSGTRNAIAAGDLNDDSLTDVVVTDSAQVSALLNITNSDNTAPTASVDANQAQGVTTSSTYNFTVTYTDSKQVDAATLGNGNLTVTYPDSSVHAATLVSQNLGNAATLQATYQITFPSNLTASNQGTYQVIMNANQVKNGNDSAAVAAGNIGSFSLVVQNPGSDTTPPTASLDASQLPGSTESSLYDFTVTYADNVAVNASTLGNGNLTVTFPDSSVHAASLVSTGLPNSSSIDATYQVAFPTLLTTADNGAYAITLAAGSVLDTSNNAAAAGNIGTLNLAVSSSQPPPAAPTGDFIVVAPTGKIITSVVTGVTPQRGGVNVRVVNGSANLLNGTVTVALYVSNTQVHDGSSFNIAPSVNHKVKKLKTGKGFMVHFPKFVYPNSGTVFLVADAALNGSLDSTDGASTAISVAPAFVDNVALAVKPGKTIVLANKKISAMVTIEDEGNVNFNLPSTYDAALVSTADSSVTQIAGLVPIRVMGMVGKVKHLMVNFLPSTLPASGTYTLEIRVNVPGDTNTGNDIATSLVTLTV